VLHACLADGGELWAEIESLESKLWSLEPHWERQLPTGLVRLALSLFQAVQEYSYTSLSQIFEAGNGASGASSVLSKYAALLGLHLAVQEIENGASDVELEPWIERCDVAIYALLYQVSSGIKAKLPLPEATTLGPEVLLGAVRFSSEEGEMLLVYNKEFKDTAAKGDSDKPWLVEPTQLLNMSEALFLAYQLEADRLTMGALLPLCQSASPCWAWSVHGQCQRHERGECKLAHSSDEEGGLGSKTLKGMVLTMQRCAFRFSKACESSGANR
jgi:hypothetical protein